MNWQIQLFLIGILYFLWKKGPALIQMYFEREVQNTSSSLDFSPPSGLILHNLVSENYEKLQKLHEETERLKKEKDEMP